MISPNNEPSPDLNHLPQSHPEVAKHYVSFTLRDHVVDGIGRGSAKDLMFRPNASFHPIREVKQDGKVCKLSFDRPLMEINRSLSEQEILDLLRSLRLGVRECALGQQLYLYPGLESFGFNLAGDLRIAFVNVRPKYRFVDYNTQHMSVLAFFELLKAFCPKTWKRIEPRSSHIMTLAALEANLTGPTMFSRFRSFIRVIMVLALIGFISSIPIALFGPASMREPLKEVLHPIFKHLSQTLSPTEAKQDESEMPKSEAINVLVPDQDKEAKPLRESRGSADQDLKVPTSESKPETKAETGTKAETQQ